MSLWIPTAAQLASQGKAACAILLVTAACVGIWYLTDRVRARFDQPQPIPHPAPHVPATWREPAAKGQAAPQQFQVSVRMPRSVERAWLREIYDGLDTESRRVQ